MKYTRIEEQSYAIFFSRRHCCIYFIIGVITGECEIDAHGQCSAELASIRHLDACKQLLAIGIVSTEQIGQAGVCLCDSGSFVFRHPIDLLQRELPGVSSIASFGSFEWGRAFPVNTGIDQQLHRPLRCLFGIACLHDETVNGRLQHNQFLVDVA